MDLNSACAMRKTKSNEEYISSDEYLLKVLKSIFKCKYNTV